MECLHMKILFACGGTAGHINPCLLHTSDAADD